MSSKAPLFGSFVFLGLMLWVSESDFYAAAEASYLKLFTMAVYGILAIASAFRGGYLHKTGKKAIGRPRTSHMVWGLVSVIVIGAIGAAAIYFQASSFN